MKYQKGDKVFYSEYETNIISGIVTRLLEKTHRYRVEYTPSYSNKPYEKMMPESRLFASANECIDSSIETLNKEIERLKSKIALLRQQKEEKVN